MKQKMQPGAPPVIDQDSFGWANAGYVAELYERWRRDPASVDAGVRAAFEGWTPDSQAAAVQERRPPAHAAPEDLRRAVAFAALVDAIRRRGHLAARIDPLGEPHAPDPVLSPQAFGLSSHDLEALPGGLVSTPVAAPGDTAAQVVECLRDVYCGTVGYDLGHVEDAGERAWLHEMAESRAFYPALSPESKRALLERLSQVEAFEQFLHTAFPGQKWFSLEGNDALILILDSVVGQAAGASLQAVVMGMAHRGRMNAIAHIFGKPYAAILRQFRFGYDYGEDSDEGIENGWTKDVKYHAGARTRFADGGMELVLLPNPSHLELVNPVVIGAVRALQEERSPNGRRPPEPVAMALLMHGDAGFAGEGIVAESLNLSQLAGYRIGGALHIVVNNQLGFTTDPEEAHSTLYPTDLARGYGIPVIHVNADDVLACFMAARLAFAYWERFHKDFVIDLVGYRRYGHNEGDEPSFTQPLMYAKVLEHPTARALWAQSLIEEGVLSPDEAREIEKQTLTPLQKALSALPQPDEDEAVPRAVPAPLNTDVEDGVPTAVPAAILKRLNSELHALPQGFNLHPKLDRPLQRRREALTGGDGRIDWAHAEALAFASILADGTPVRLTGQDTERGTFSQRHAVLHDVEIGAAVVPLHEMPSAHAPFAVYNSPLSEVGALAFEYGYSVQAPRAFVLWEAQFGDFINNAQAVVDEFIASAWAKWGQRSGLTLLLPHGDEGQGPDHSNAYLERFLALAAEGNMRVANCTTAAQYFHLLRRQAALLAEDPRPLIIMTPKSLLRRPMAMSSGDELSTGAFQPVIDDARVQHDASGVRRVLFCTGKVAIDLLSSGQASSAADVAIVRVERLSPFPARKAAAALQQYSQAHEVVWLQEEPQNRGAWGYMQPRIEALLPGDLALRYIGRPARASSAEGTARLHRIEQERIVHEAFAPLGRKR